MWGMTVPRILVLILLAATLLPAASACRLIAAYAAIPIIHARMEREIRLQEGRPLAFVQGIAVASSGAVFAADREGKQLVAFPDGSSTSGRVLTLGASGEPLLAPQAVALGLDGTVHLADRDSGIVSLFAENGTPLRVFKGGLPGISAIATDLEGRLYVADPAAGGIRRFEASGDPDISWGAPRPGLAEVPSVAGLAWMGGTLYASSPRSIARLDTKGRIIDQRPLVGNGGLLGNGPTGKLVMSDFTVDSPGVRWQTFRVWVLDAEGRTVGRVVGPNGRDDLFRQPRGVAVGPLGRLYVANGDRITVYRLAEA